MKRNIIISLFDGMSCGQIALSKFLKSNQYNWCASEINKASMNMTQFNFPNTIQLGDVRNVTSKLIGNVADGEVFIVMGGSPCQNFSSAGSRNGMITDDDIEITSLKQYLRLKKQGYVFKGESYLFWELVRVIKETNPKYFLLENVVMKGQTKRWEKIISKVLGVEPIRINSSLVTAQNRDRLYWTNIPNITIPKDENILMSDIIEGAVSGFGIRGTDKGELKPNGKPLYKQNGTTRVDGKSNCLTKSSPTRKVMMYDGTTRPLTVEECEMLQGVPVGYTDVLGVSKTARYEALGNGWTIPVIEHIFSHIPELIKKKSGVSK
jgi:site-specific DNA-cytosine methylase